MAELERVGMQAIEFIGKEKKGIIKIPKEYHGKLKKDFRVIILIDTELSGTISEFPHKKFKRLSKVRVKTRGFKFDREEANAR